MKKILSILAIAIILALISYFTMTPMGALRIGIALYGYPVEAVTLQLRENPYNFHLEKNQIGYSLANPPVAEVTDSELVNWVVTRYGPFYIAEYYGWC